MKEKGEREGEEVELERNRGEREVEEVGVGRGVREEGKEGE